MKGYGKKCGTKVALCVGASVLLAVLFVLCIEAFKRYDATYQEAAANKEFVTTFIERNKDYTYYNGSNIISLVERLESEPVIREVKSDITDVVTFNEALRDIQRIAKTDLNDSVKCEYAHTNYSIVSNAMRNLKANVVVLEDSMTKSTVIMVIAVILFVAIPFAIGYLLLSAAELRRERIERQKECLKRARKIASNDRVLKLYNLSR